MLKRSTAGSEPTVIGYIQQPAGTADPGLLRRSHIARENNFVTDQRGQGRQPGERQGHRTGASAEIGSPGSEFIETKPVAQRHVFAKRHQMKLVVCRHDPPGPVDRMETVPDAERKDAARRGPDGAGEQ